jgi:uncharacterized protein YceH (UPF0502 family)
MAELLLRGTQTVGELRGRAARMEPIKDLAELQPTLDSLRAKGLVVYLTPPGRGSIVTHALYLEHEMEKVRREAGAHLSIDAQTSRGEVAADFGGPTTRHMPVAECTSQVATVTSRQQNRHESSSGQAPYRSQAAGEDPLEGELRRVQEELVDLKQQLLATRTEFEDIAQDLRRQLDDLNRQLGN